MGKWLVLLGQLAALPAHAGGNPKVEAAIKLAIADDDAAWGRHDAKALAAGYTEDGTALNAMGVSMTGRSEIETQFAQLFGGPLKKSAHHMTVKTIKLVRPDVAVVDGDVEVTNLLGPDGKPATVMKHHTTEVMVKEGGKWLVSDNRGFMIVPPK